MSVYINPYTDFGFKKLFGEEGSKALLIDFLNQLLPAHHQIQELAFQNVEALPETTEERKAFFDIHCVAESGERFIVEMQKAKVAYFKDRSLYYVTYPIREQAQRGDWDFKLSAIYFIGILDFLYEKEANPEFRRDIVLKDQHNKPFYDKLQLTYLQMPAFHKTEAELATHFDKWAYFLKNLETFEGIPQILNEPIFTQAFHTAKVANFSPEQRNEYEKSRLSYIGIKQITATAEEDGLQKGREAGLQEGLQKGRQEGLQQGEEKAIQQAVLGFYENEIPVSLIAKSLKISEEKVEKIIAQHKK